MAFMGGHAQVSVSIVADEGSFSMRKVAGVLFAVAMLLPVALVASPAGAAGGTSCTVPTGKISVTPGLTNVPTKNKITFTLPFTKCSGGGVTSGTSVGVIPPGKPGTCASLATAGPMTITTTITWNNKKTSTFVGKSNTKAGGPKGFVATSTVTGKVTKGVFLNLGVSVKVAVKLGAGACTKASPIKTLTVTGISPFVIK
jgi:hypothetical protein